jgi:hypothetical protein
MTQPNISKFSFSGWHDQVLPSSCHILVFRVGPDPISEVDVRSQLGYCPASAIRSSSLLQSTKLIAGPPMTEATERCARQIQIEIAQIDGIVMRQGASQHEGGIPLDSSGAFYRVANHSEFSVLEHLSRRCIVWKAAFRAHAHGATLFG